MHVYLAYPWMFPDSAYYRYLIRYPPAGVVYANNKQNFDILQSTQKFWLNNFAKNLARRTAEIVKNPNFSIKLPKSDIDLIHCAHCFARGQKPFVVDLEAYWTFAPTGEIAYSKTGKRKIQKLLENRRCSRILPWTEATKNEILKTIKSEIVRRKTEVLYPAVPLQNANRKSRDKPTLLYVARQFFIKGGLVALETLRTLKRKYDINVIFISDVPKKIKDKYAEITMSNVIPQNKLFDYLKRADIFFYPSFVDTFGFAQIEAMSFGMPVVAVDGFAKKEIVSDGKNGFVVERPTQINFYHIGKAEQKLIDTLVEKSALLIEDSKLRKQMSRAAKKEVETGKFSIKYRNAKLGEIYKNAVQF